MPKSPVPLRQVRDAMYDGGRHVSQRRLAELIGSPEITLKKIEHGDRLMSSALAAKLLDLTGVDPESLMPPSVQALDLFTKAPFDRDTFDRYLGMQALQAAARDQKVDDNEVLNQRAKEIDDLCLLLRFLLESAAGSGKFAGVVGELHALMNRLRARYDLGVEIDALIEAENPRRRQRTTAGKVKKTYREAGKPKTAHALETFLPAALDGMEVDEHVPLRWPHPLGAVAPTPGAAAPAAHSGSARIEKYSRGKLVRTLQVSPPVDRPTNDLKRPTPS